MGHYDDLRDRDYERKRLRDLENAMLIEMNYNDYVKLLDAGFYHGQIKALNEVFGK